MKTNELTRLAHQLRRMASDPANLYRAKLLDEAATYIEVVIIKLDAAKMEV